MSLGKHHYSVTEGFFCLPPGTQCWLWVFLGITVWMFQLNCVPFFLLIQCKALSQLFCFQSHVYLLRSMCKRKQHKNVDRYPVSCPVARLFCSLSPALGAASASLNRTDGNVADF